MKTVILSLLILCAATPTHAGLFSRFRRQPARVIYSQPQARQCYTDPFTGKTTCKLAPVK